MGLTPGAIKHRIIRGDLVRVFHGVYAVGRAGLGRRGRWLAAVLTCGDGAVLSHVSAARHWGLLTADQARLDVSVPSPRKVSARPGLRIHHTRLHSHDTTIREAIPVTTPMRTLLDIASAAPRHLDDAFDCSLEHRLYDHTKLTALLDRSTGRSGLRALRDRASEAPDEAPILRSHLERQFRRLCRAHSIPPPATNVLVEGIEVDAYWPQARLVVELDGFAYHRDRETFERDRARDRRLLLAGHRVMRLTADDLTHRAARVAKEVLAALAR